MACGILSSLVPMNFVVCVVAAWLLLLLLLLLLLTMMMTIWTFVVVDVVPMQTVGVPFVPFLPTSTKYDLFVSENNRCDVERS